MTTSTEIEPQRRNEETTPPERDLEQPATDEETKEEGEPKPDPDGKALFDSSDYEREDLAIAKVDGEGIDKIRVKFSGSVMLDRGAPADVALYNALRLGREVELRCAGKVSGVSTGWTTNREGDLDAVVGERALKVETVWVLDPEDL